MIDVDDDHDHDDHHRRAIHGGKGVIVDLTDDGDEPPVERGVSKKRQFRDDDDSVGGVGSSEGERESVDVKRRKMLQAAMRRAGSST